MRTLPVLLLVGCIPLEFDKTGGSESASPDSADTAETVPTDEDCPNGRYDGPVVLVNASVICTGTEARFAAETQGLTGDGWVYLQETAQITTPQWAENHFIHTVEFDLCGFSDWLDVELADGSTLIDPTNDWESGESTVFTCAQLEDNAYMTFAFGVKDHSGVLADCLAFGHDVPGLTGRVHDVAGEEPDFAVGDCVEGVEGQ